MFVTPMGIIIFGLQMRTHTHLAVTPYPVPYLSNPPAIDNYLFTLSL